MPPHHFLSSPERCAGQESPECVGRHTDCATKRWVRERCPQMCKEQSCSATLSKWMQTGDGARWAFSADELCKDELCRQASAPSKLFAAVPQDASLVVVGAHHFGKDPNDPLYKHVSRVAWSDVLLVEANPAVATELRADVAAHNPMPFVQPGRVRVVNHGVCPGEKEQMLPFYTFRSIRGLPFWASQISSFSRQHVTKHLPFLSYHSHIHGFNYTIDELRKQVVVTSVVCTSLLRRQSIHRLAVLLIDTEGLDCDLVASQHWSSWEWCGSLRPTALIFEHKHCSRQAYANATASLARHRQCSALPGAPIAPFRRIAQTGENVFFGRAAEVRRAPV